MAPAPAMRRTCSCGAIGDILPADIGYPDDVRSALVEWHGGKIGGGRIAVEDLPADLTLCPVCQHRACAYVAAPPTGPGRAGSGEG